MTGVNARERRRRQTAETRSAIVSAAAELFAERGYTGTTIEGIAELEAGGFTISEGLAARAGVVVQTIYNSVGPKSSVLSAVLDRAAAGAEAPKSVPEFMRERAEATGDAAGMIEVLADWFVEAQPRTVEVHNIIRQAAAQDEDIAALEERRATQRFQNYLQAAQQLAMRPGSVSLPPEDVAATIWSVGHPQVYRFLVEVAGWDLDHYRHWVARSLAAGLTEPAEP